MNESEQKRFKWLCDEGEMAKIDELKEFVKFNKSLYGENANLREKVKDLELNRKGLYQHWCDGWVNITGADTFGMVCGHIILVVAFIFAMIGAWHLVKPAPVIPRPILTNRYYLARSTTPEVGACTQVQQIVLHGTDVTASKCFKDDKAALRYAVHLVETTGGTFKREEAKQVDKEESDEME